MTLALREPAIHPEGNAIFDLVEGPISPEMERSVRGVSLLRAKRLAVSAPREQRHQCQRRPLLAKTKLLSLRNTIGVLSTESILSTNTWWDIINRHRDKRFSVAKAQALRRARWGGSLALELLRLAVLSGQTRLSVDETSLRCFSSGQTRLSVDETAL